MLPLSCAFGFSAAFGAAFKARRLFSDAHAAAKPSPFSPNEFRKFTLLSSIDESPDSKIFRFALPEADMTCQLPCASCIVTRCDGKDGKPVFRPYTPITPCNQLGYFELLVKKYKGSAMGSHLFSLKKGDTLDVKGPFFKIPIGPNQYKSIGMIAGGTGITPMFQVLKMLTEGENGKPSKTDVRLVFASRRKEDILLGNELQDMGRQFPNIFTYFVLSQPSKDWAGGIGHINEEMIKSYIPGPDKSAKENIVLVCGPDGFMESICGPKDYKTSSPSQGELGGLLKKLGYSSNQVFKF